jgi:hypothetical protein
MIIRRCHQAIHELKKLSHDGKNKEYTTIIKIDRYENPPFPQGRIANGTQNNKRLNNQ